MLRKRFAQAKKAVSAMDNKGRLDISALVLVLLFFVIGIELLDPLGDAVEDVNSTKVGTSAESLADLSPFIMVAGIIVAGVTVLFAQGR